MRQQVFVKIVAVESFLNSAVSAAVFLIRGLRYAATPAYLQTSRVCGNVWRRGYKMIIIHYREENLEVQLSRCYCRCCSALSENNLENCRYKGPQI